MPGGRPTKYKPEMCDLVISEMSDGASKEACAGALGVAVSTLYKWIDEKPEFSEAIKRGEALSRVWWEEKARQAVIGELPGFNPTAWVFCMKNIHGWRDKTEVTGKDGGPIETTSKVLNVNGV